MKAKELHSWDLSWEEAKELQVRLSRMVVKSGDVNPKFIAGVDLSFPDPDGFALGCAVVLKFPELSLVEVKTERMRVSFPYIPGLLSFRESPVVIRALEKLEVEPDLIMVDGQGLAHPRRFGIACHIGLLFEKPTIGCAKSLLCGKHEEVPEEEGSFSWIWDQDEIIGAVLRTRRGRNPVYVSIGHKISLECAIKWVLRCVRGHRIPEPLRLSHLGSKGRIKDTGFQGRLF